MKSQLFLILLVTTYACLGQSEKQVGSVNVKSRLYSGMELIIQGGVFSDANEYNDFNYKDTFSTIKRSAKLFKGSSVESKILIETKYPHPFQIGYLDTLSGAVTYSHYFFVGNSKVKINLEDLFKEKDVLRGKLSKENKEYSKLQDIYKAYVNRQTGEVYNLSGKLEVIRLYILENPESFVALWDLVLNYNWIKSEGDRRRVLTVIQNFSSSIQNTKTFRALSNKIVNDLQLAEGGRMPNIIFDGNDTLLSVVSKNRYTLVDFWFTSCQPCLNQFGKFKSIYEKNRHKGFEIIGVSIDDKERTFQLQEVIRKFDLSWVQFRDPGGVEASRLFIVGYPANFLLDKDGKIVKKDISPEDLGKYLENELLKF